MEAGQLASVTERHPDVFKVLIREIGQDGKADVVLGKSLSMTEMEKLNRRVELSQNSKRQNGGYDQHRPKLRLCSAIWKKKFHNEIPNSAAVLTRWCPQ
jgi:hypothetical protein